MIRLLTMVFLSFFTCTINAQIGNVMREGELFDTWENNDLNRVVRLQVKPDGTCLLNEQVHRCTFADSTLTLSTDISATTYGYQVTGKKLTLTGGDLNAPVIFIRSGAAAEERPKSRGSLYGKWEGNGEFFEFHPNGRCFYLGESYPYRLTQEEITLITPQKEIVLVYRVEENVLYLTSYGQTSKFQRVP